jgi:hypothetical protein
VNKLLNRLYYYWAASVIISFWIALFCYAFDESFYIVFFVSSFMVFGIILSLSVLMHILLELGDLK